MSFLCLFFGHDFEPIETLTPYCTKLQCYRCHNYFVHRVCDGNETTTRWTDAMEQSMRIRKQVRRMLACKGER